MMDIEVDHYRDEHGKHCWELDGSTEVYHNLVDLYEKCLEIAQVDVVIYDEGDE